jgi:hypothetical protein
MLRRESLRVRLIEPAAPRINILSYGFCPRLGLPIMGAALKAAGHDVRRRRPMMRPPGSTWTKGRDAGEPRLAGLSERTR